MTTKTERIRALNDTLRATGIGGCIVITNGIATLQPPEVEAVLQAVQTFTDFNPDNDPHGEHDCAVLTAAGEHGQLACLRTEVHHVHGCLPLLDFVERRRREGLRDGNGGHRTCRL